MTQQKPHAFEDDLGRPARCKRCGLFASDPIHGQEPTHERVRCTRDGCDCCVRCGGRASDAIHVRNAEVSENRGQGSNPDIHTIPPLAPPEWKEAQHIGGHVIGCDMLGPLTNKRCTCPAPPPSPAPAETSEEQRLKAVIHRMTLMLSDFGRHDSECVCSADKTQHAADCKDCECGLRDAVEFGIEQSGFSLEPPDMTPEEEVRLREIEKRVVDKALAAAFAGREK